jgi:hypothetical protein
LNPVAEYEEKEFKETIHIEEQLDSPKNKPDNLQHFLKRSRQLKEHVMKGDEFPETSNAII